MAGVPPELPSDLAAILARLPQPALDAHTSLPPHPANTDPDERNHALPFLNSLIQPHSQTPTPPPPSTHPQLYSHGQIIDPATITEWSAGLRCVSKLAQQNINFANCIKTMMKNQRRNEIDWYTKRQELKKEQSLRGSGLGQLTSIMQSIGASVSNGDGKPPRSEEELQAELEAFDAKIHRAQAEMNKAMTEELKALGVPFFGTDATLVTGSVAADAMPATGPKWSPKITAGELRGLQQRMISYLEDMYKD